jgi:hypothetical protein
MNLPIQLIIEEEESSIDLNKFSVSSLSSSSIFHLNYEIKYE